MRPGFWWFPLAPLVPAALLLACGSTPPPAPIPVPGRTGCADVNGAFLFESLARSCRVRGAFGGLPKYPIQDGGRLRGPRDFHDFLPLPLAHWGDPGTRVEIASAGCSSLAFTLSQAGSQAPPYLHYEIDLADLARTGAMSASDAGLRFESAWAREDLQIPIGISRKRESWSLTRDREGRLVYSYSMREKGALLWLIPMRSHVEVECVLPQTVRPQGKERSTMDSTRTGDLSRVDHVILGINDLQKGIEELERRTGVRAAFGGAHPGRGTQNALLSLGGNHYLEILAPNPEEKGGERAEELLGLTALTPVGWAVHTDDIAALQQTLRSHGTQTGEIRPGARNRPDGTRLAWKTLDYTAPSSPLLPFFIEWDPASAHPSTTSPEGCRLAGLSLEDPAPESLRKALRAAEVEVEVREGKESRIHISLACPQGNVGF